MIQFFDFFASHFYISIFLLLVVYAAAYFFAMRLERHLVDDKFQLYGTKDERKAIRELKRKMAQEAREERKAAKKNS